jgi:hypothetical protein
MLSEDKNRSDMCVAILTPILYIASQRPGNLFELLKNGTFGVKPGVSRQAVLVHALILGCVEMAVGARNLLHFGQVLPDDRCAPYGNV